jgi:hypothetical protein
MVSEFDPQRILGAPNDPTLIDDRQQACATIGNSKFELTRPPLTHAVRAAIPQTDPLAKAEFTTIRERLIKIGARVIEHIARVRIQLPTSCPEGALFRAVAFGLMPSAP